MWHDDEVTPKQQEATSAILRHIGLDDTQPCTKQQLMVLVNHVRISQALRQWACAENFVQWAELVSSADARMAYFRLHCAPYSVVPGYSGNALHYAARDRMLQSPVCMPYAVAMLRYLGCDLDSQEDSRGDCANLLVARALGSHDVFVPASLLLRWLHNRTSPGYVPCDETRALLNLQ